MGGIPDRLDGGQKRGLAGAVLTDQKGKRRQGEPSAPRGSNGKFFSLNSRNWR